MRLGKAKNNFPIVLMLTTHHTLHRQSQSKAAKAKDRSKKKKTHAETN